MSRIPYDLAFAVLALMSILSGPARANVPVNDQAILERKSQESTTKVELKTILGGTRQKREGIKCAVTKGGRGNVQNLGQQPNPSTGSGAVQRYAPGMPSAPETGATGGTLSEQQLGAESGRVVSGVEASQGTVGSTQGAYRSRTGEVGSAQTVMEAFDQNTAIRIQNGMTWNQTIATANLLVQALNALNLANQSETSQTSVVITGPTPPQPPTGGNCPTGYLGTGSVSDPCRPNQCSTTPSGTPADPACVTRRFLDSDGNVVVFLDLASRLSLRPEALGTAASPQSRPITATELQEALAASQRLARGQN